MGGLENYPDVIDRLALVRPIWGNDSTALRRCRDPFFLSQLFADNRLLCPKVARVPNHLCTLQKPLRSAGGAHIGFVPATAAAAPGFYYQQYIDGRSYAAIFCALAGSVETLGVTEQLIGEPWLNAKPFRYAGSIGPVDLGRSVHLELQRMASALCIACGLRGLFGIDFVVNDDGAWLIEVNPRYTASVEVLELATGLQSFAYQRAAFTGQAIEHAKPFSKKMIAKAILFALQPLSFPDPKLAFSDLKIEIADIPNVGESIEEGWPILTLFARGASRDECGAALECDAEKIYKRL